MKILVVDDEEMIRDVIREYCLKANYQVDEASDGLIALEKVKNNKYDLLILDVMMPNMDGFSMLSELSEKERIPTIILSARNEEFDKLKGFELGIDDYLTKPFSPKELIARINAVSKRYNKFSTHDVYTYDNLEIDFSAHSLKIDNNIVNITPKEFEIISYLIKNRGIAISREQLLANVWGYDFFGDDRTVDTHIKMLRGNLGKYRNLIVTVRGVGYKFIDEEK